MRTSSSKTINDRIVTVSNRKPGVNPNAPGHGTFTGTGTGAGTFYVRRRGVASGGWIREQADRDSHRAQEEAGADRRSHQGSRRAPRTARWPPRHQPQGAHEVPLG